MVEVFITNVRELIEAKRMQNILENSFPELKINFDLETSERPFPCGHTILRAEGAIINPETIISTTRESGFMSEILADKICK